MVFSLVLSEIIKMFTDLPGGRKGCTKTSQTFLPAERDTLRKGFPTVCFEKMRYFTPCTGNVIRYFTPCAGIFILY